MSQARAWALPGAALVAVAGLMGVQLAFGGADFVPTAVASPCTERPLPAASQDLDQVTQAVVVGGVQDAACDLGTTREELLLALPSATDRAALAAKLGKTEDELMAAVKQGMLATVDRMDQGGRLPKASSLVSTYGDQLGLPPLAVTAAQNLPPEMIDNLLPTGAIVKRAIDHLDLATLLENSADPASWEPAVRDAIRDAAIAEVKDRISEQLQGGLGGLFGGG